MPAVVRPVLRLGLLLCALGAPAAASAQTPDLPPPAEAAGDWYDHLDDSGDDPAAVALPVTPVTPARPVPSVPSVPAAPATPPGTGLRGVPYRALILRYAARRGLEPALVAAVIQAESGFRPQVVSKVGARGLMQLMPATARAMGARVARLFDPETNIAAGTRYLATLKRAFSGNVRLVAAAYNAGPGAVRRYHGVPPFVETRAYVARVLAFRLRYLGAA
jgi:soluble lytic murein transglycosylase-like protein